MNQTETALQNPETVGNKHAPMQELIYQFFDEAPASSACETLSFLFNKHLASGEFDSTNIKDQDKAFDVDRISNFIVKLQELKENW